MQYQKKKKGKRKKKKRIGVGITKIKGKEREIGDVWLWGIGTCRKLSFRISYKVVNIV